MGRYLKLLIGLVVFGLVASILVVSVAFADEPKPQGGPQAFASNFVSKLAKALGKTDEEVGDAIKQAQREIIDEALQEGRIGQERAEKALERLDSGGLFAGFPPRIKQIPARATHLMAKGQILKSAADFLGLPPGQVMKNLRHGQSLAELAEEQGKTRDELKAAITDSAKQALDKFLANGKLGQQQVDSMLQRLEENLDKIIDQKHQGPPAVNPARAKKPKI